MPEALPYQPPSLEFWLGTDALADSVALRLANATWHTFISVALTAIVALLIGTTVGVFLGLRRRGLLRAACEVFLAFSFAAPLLLLVLLLLVTYGDSPWVFPAVGFLAWGGIAFAAATSIERLSGTGYVRASKALGATPSIAYLRHGLQHVLPAIITATTALCAQLFQLTILLSFIGIGRRGLGALVREGYQLYPSMWWTWLPATFVAAALLGCATWLANRGSHHG